VSFDDTMSELPEARWLAREIGASDEVGITVTDYEAARAAIASSDCQGLLPVFLAENDTLLVRMEANSPEVSRELWLLCHRPIRHTARIKAVTGWIEEVVARTLGSGK
jgi:DNA-binding transcriptional LysR family regulator